MSTDSSALGFIGLGKMDAAMANRLLKMGHRLTVCDADPQALTRMVRRAGRQRPAQQTWGRAYPWCSPVCPHRTSLRPYCSAATHCAEVARSKWAQAVKASGARELTPSANIPRGGGKAR